MVSKKDYQLAKKRHNKLAELKKNQPKSKKRQRQGNSTSNPAPEKRRKTDLSTAPEGKIQRKCMTSSFISMFLGYFSLICRCG